MTREKICNLELPLEAEMVQEGKEWKPEEVKKKLSEAYFLMQQAKEDSDKARYHESIKLLLKAGEIYEKILGAEHLETASVYFELARVYAELFECKKAEELCRKTLEIRKKS